MLSVITESRSNEKFSVEKLLESQNRKLRKQSEEEMETEGTALHLIKKPNLKFGIDSILKEEKKELPLRPVVKCKKTMYFINFYNIFSTFHF